MNKLPLVTTRPGGRKGQAPVNGSWFGSWFRVHGLVHGLGHLPDTQEYLGLLSEPFNTTQTI